MSGAAERFEGRLFRLGKAGTITLVVMIVAALAGAGILAGLIAGRATPVPVRGTRDAPMLVGGAPGPAAAAAGAPRSLPSGVRPGGLLASAGSVAVPGGVAQISPSPVPASPVQASPTPVQTTAPPGGSVDVDGIPLPVPQGWSVLASGPNWAQVANGRAIVYAEVDRDIDPASDVPQLTRGVYQVLVGANAAYSGLADPDTLTVDEYQPFGGLVGRAGIFYLGLYTDQQGAYDLAGQVYLLLRQDGRALVLHEEVAPYTDWDTRWTDACPTLYRPVIEAFAGEPFPYDPCG